MSGRLSANDSSLRHRNGDAAPPPGEENGEPQFDEEVKEIIPKRSERSSRSKKLMHFHRYEDKPEPPVHPDYRPSKCSGSKKALCVGDDFDPKTHAY
jgi:hypothetical protein